LPEWLSAINRGKGALVDIVGGEPSMLPGIYDFCRELESWAMTTNLIDWPVWEPFLQKTLQNCACITCSWSEQMPEKQFLDRVYALSSAGYHTVVSLVIPTVRWLPVRGIPVATNERFSHKFHLERTSRSCNAGMNHISISDDGEIYPCQAWQMVRRNSLGNLFEHGLKYGNDKHNCNLSCLPCYKQGQHGVRLESL